MRMSPTGATRCLRTSLPSRRLVRHPRSNKAETIGGDTTMLIDGHNDLAWAMRRSTTPTWTPST
jgi:hypothetical protein